jgi:hypothetical protein
MAEVITEAAGLTQIERLDLFDGFDLVCRAW